MRVADLNLNECNMKTKRGNEVDLQEKVEDVERHDRTSPERTEHTGCPVQKRQIYYHFSILQG